MAKSSTKTRRDKPSKPRPDFPLFPHATGRWAKKIKGKLHYFGSRDDPDGALERYLDQRDDLMAGRKPRQKRDGLSVEDACNAFLHPKRQKVESGERSSAGTGKPQWLQGGVAMPSSSYSSPPCHRQAIRRQAREGASLDRELDE